MTRTDGLDAVMDNAEGDPVLAAFIDMCQRKVIVAVFTQKIEIAVRLIQSVQSVFTSPVMGHPVKVMPYFIDDADSDAAKLAHKLQVRSSPTIILFVNGVMHMRTVGADPNVGFMFLTEVQNTLKRMPETALDCVTDDV